MARAAPALAFKFAAVTVRRWSPATDVARGAGRVGLDPMVGAQGNNLNRPALAAWGPGERVDPGPAVGCLVVRGDVNVTVTVTGSRRHSSGCDDGRARHGVASSLASTCTSVVAAAVIQPSVLRWNAVRRIRAARAGHGPRLAGELLKLTAPPLA